MGRAGTKRATCFPWRVTSPCSTKSSSWPSLFLASKAPTSRKGILSNCQSPDERRSRPRLTKNPWGPRPAKGGTKHPSALQPDSLKRLRNLALFFVNFIIYNLELFSLFTDLGKKQATPPRPRIDRAATAGRGTLHCDPPAGVRCPAHPDLGSRAPATSAP